MCVPIPHIYCIRISGAHRALLAKTYYGLAFDMSEAMRRTCARASMDGWADIAIEQVSDYGEIEFGACFDETEVTPCKPSCCP